MTGPLVARVDALAAQEGDHMVRLRRHLHQNPELSYQEFRTADRIDDELRTAGFEPIRPTPTSVLATLRTGADGPVLVVRADMDALPVQEATGLAFTSRTDGVMHACGHDGHMAIVVGVARAVAALADHLTGEIRFLFQHAEEPLPSGAPEIIEQGVVDDADAIVGLHLWAPLPAGQVAAPAGTLMASTDYFDIAIAGRGGHAGLPHEVVDPISIGAHTMTGLRHIVAQETNPLESLVVAVTRFHGGEHNAVVPDSATLGGTVRAVTEDARQRAATRIEEVARAVAHAYGGTSDVAYTFGSPAVVNDSDLASTAHRVIRDHLGADALAQIDPVMAGEDFAWYQKRLRGMFYLVGAGPADQPAYPHHHPRFDIDEAALAVGMKLLLGTILDVCALEDRA